MTKEPGEARDDAPATVHRQLPGRRGSRASHRQINDSWPVVHGGRTPLLLDVDGVVNCLAVGSFDQADRGLTAHEAIGPDGRAYEILIDPATPDRIARLAEAFEIVWCTTWQQAANAEIAPLIHLPSDREVIWLPTDWADVPLHVSRKTFHLLRWANENHVSRLAWIDDEIAPRDKAALTEPDNSCRQSAGLTALDEVCIVRTNPRIGLTDRHVDRLLAWAEGCDE